ncbi:MAG: hypothetical protein CYPHOPRED_000784 [Cyphobasidiales sp. Tagirdzhanova-0007]|nr:MAG: hypothetical protein CYPHOPRED_000784 [Cyphobasidiales sp. Tagirdzhanova-0007]
MDLDERDDAGPSTFVGPNGIHAQHQPNGQNTNENFELDDWPTLYPSEVKGIAPARLSGSQDFVALFNLSSSYDTFVRPYLASNLSDAAVRQNSPSNSKGKGRATIPDETDDVGGLAGAGRDNERARGKSMKKHYSHLIVDVPGQNKLAKDHHLRDLLLDPDPPNGILPALPFDSQTLRDAFTLEVGGLPDFDTSIWRADADENRRKSRKKRKQDEPINPSVVTRVPSPATSANKKRKMDA